MLLLFVLACVVGAHGPQQCQTDHDPHDFVVLSEEVNRRLVSGTVVVVCCCHDPVVYGKQEPRIFYYPQFLSTAESEALKVIMLLLLS